MQRVWGNIGKRSNEQCRITVQKWQRMQQNNKKANVTETDRGHSFFQQYSVMHFTCSS